MKKLIVTFLLVLTGTTIANGQKYQEPELRRILDSLSVRHTGLNNSLQLNVFGLPLYELITSVAMENNLNLTVDPSLNQMISYNFYDAKVKDMLVFLYGNFELEYDFVGSIISVKKRPQQVARPPVVAAREIDVTYNKANEFLSMDLKNDTLWKVLEKITKISDRNFILSPDVRNKPVNAFIQNRPFEQVMEIFVKSNTLNIYKEKEGYYSVSAGTASDPAAASSGRNNAGRGGQRNTGVASGDLLLSKTPAGTLNISASNVDLMELLKTAASELNVYYVLHSSLEGKVNLEISDITFEGLLQKIFNTTKYNYKKDQQFFIIGELGMEGLRKTELVRLENRTIENVKTVIPKDLISGLEITEFVELNGLIVSGSERAVSELRSFLLAIDVVVPMVQIDVMLIVSRSGRTVETGVKAGLRDNPTNTNGGMGNPDGNGLNVEMGANTINAILNTISGFGFVNLGQVTENFYISLKALEDNNVVDIESTPKISTLNGHQAKISIGETTYYQEQQVNVQTTLNNQGIIQSRIWKSIDANLSVVIKPFVSADEYVTLTISVDQNDFSGRSGENAPPNSITQKFESMVRVKNGEVILLGGLEEKSKSQATSGIPILSRIPVLRWIFGSRKKSKDKSKLHILIKPTVTY